MSRVRMPRLIAASAVLMLLGGNSCLLSSPELTAVSAEETSEPEFACSRTAQAAMPDLPAVPAGGDLAAVRSVWDPYPSLHSVAVDSVNNRVVMSDSNRGSLLFYERGGGSKYPKVISPEQQVRGPATGMMFIAGVAIDPAHKEVFAVNNDIGDRVEVFPYDADGNVKPKRVLFVPHGAWGISLDSARDEIAISVEHINSVLVYRREAAAGEAPLRVIHGPNTGLADPHGIAVDAANRGIVVANHGNWAPLTRAEAMEGGLHGGSFQEPSVSTYSDAAKGDARPARTIQGKRTQLNWPMGVGIDTVHNEIAVASYGSNSILIFRRDDEGDAAPVRVLRGNQTGILGPMGVAIDTKNDELWVTNYRDHSALVFPRTAQGNIAPKRVLRNAPPGVPVVGFGNPGAVAYDSRRGQILVPN
jgi:DNA-binding beta-propeller fold protein YncE